MRHKKINKLISLILVLGLVFSAGITTAYAGNAGGPTGPADPYEDLTLDQNHYTLDELVELFGGALDGDEMLRYDAFVYKGWRTSYGNWLNEVMLDLKDRLEGVGYQEGERTTAGNQGDSVWFQNEKDPGNAWNPQYVSLQITGIKGELDESPVPLTEEQEALAEEINVLADCIDPTSIYYPEHINDDGTWLYEALQKGEGDPDYIKMQQVNKRVHLPTNAPFTALTDPALDAEKNIAAGTKNAQVVFIGEVTADGNSEGISAAELAGKILLTTTTGASACNYANSVGALAVLIRVSDAPNYHMPVIDGERWYTSYVPYGGMGRNYPYAAPGVTVPFHFSLDQFAAMEELLEQGKVYMSVCALGTYESVPRRMLVAEIQGAVKPEERIYVPAHINEPGAHDNASGVAMNYVIAKTMLEMINNGELARPERTITFVWGDEITMTNWWREKYRDEFLNVKGSIDLDMTGADPAKTGSSMLIEKTPDPSDVATDAVDSDLLYRYGNFTFPGQANLPLQYNTFIRKPDKFSLWTGGTKSVTTPVNNYPGFYLNDLYLQTGLLVKEKLNSEFLVDSNPYEGGSDHSPFVEDALSEVGTFIPALLTWHFTDYVYHSSCDTLDKLSVTEFHDVGTVSAAVAYQMANGGEAEAADTIAQVLKGWETRMGYEKQNTEDHYQWMLDNPTHVQAPRSYDRELKAIGDWSRWYVEAVKSPGRLMTGRSIGTPYTLSPELQAIEDAAVSRIQAETIDALDYVDEVFGKDSADRPIQVATANLAEPIFVPTGKYASAAALAAAELPSKITVEYVGGGTGEADVAWSATTDPAFSGTRNGLYRFTGTLSGLEGGVVNWAVVQAAAEVNTYTDAVKPGVYLENTAVSGRVSDTVTLKAIAESYDGGELSYQWYKNSARDVVGGEAIENAADSEYTFALPEVPGTAYYYCVVTNTNDGAEGEITASINSEIATVTATPKSEPSDPGVYYVYYNGNIYTEMDDPNKPFKTAEAIVTLGQWIVYVGDDDDETGDLADWIASEEAAESVDIGDPSAPGTDAVWIDLEGKTVIPGIHDSHIHIESGGNTLSMPDIFWKPKAEILGIIAAEAAKTPAGEWIQARGWNQTLVTWDGGKTDFPTKEELDAVAPNNPVALTRTDSHAMWVNSLALEKVDIYKDGKINDLPDPEGGAIIRNAEGEATGVLIDTAFWPVRDVIPVADEAENIRQLYNVQQHCFKHGITSVMNAGSQMPAINRIMKEFQTGDDLKLRIYLEIRSYHDGIQNDILFRDQVSEVPLINEYDYRFTARATKVTLDGALGSRGASLIEPYADAGQDGTAPDYRGASLRFTDEQLYDLFKRNFGSGFTFSAHCIGDAANEQFLRVYEQFLIEEGYIDEEWDPADVKALDLRPRIEHFQIVAPGHIEKAAALGITPSMQFVHATSDMSMAGIRVGEERLKHAYAWRQILDAGMEIANGTDWSVDLINPYHGLYAAVTRLDRKGNSPRGEGIPWNPIDTATTEGSDERLTRAEALHAYTYGGAYAQFEEDIKGTLEVGKLADFVVIDRDYFDRETCPDFAIKDINAVVTVLGGEVVYTMEEPQITSLSLPNAALGIPYATTLYGTGSPTLEWSIPEMDKGLEDWLKIDSHSGELSGVPTTAGTFELTVTAKNYLGSDTKRMNIIVTKPSSPSPSRPDRDTVVQPPVPPEAWVNPFSDVRTGDWFYEAVQYAYENGLMQGTGASLFSPHSTTTRGMIVAILYRMEGSPSMTAANLFHDVTAGQYYTDAVIWASDNEIVSGYGNGKFGPNDPITREQMALILMNYARFKGYDVSARAVLSGFSDASAVSAWAFDALSWANAKGLILGSNNKLMPGGNAERAQVAAILQRFEEMYGN